MFFRETKETEEDIKRMFHLVRDSLKKRITLAKRSDPGKFTVPCSIRGIEFPRALCDTGSGVSIIPKIMADHLHLTIEPTDEKFIFVDCSQQNSGGIIRNLEVRIGDAIIPTDFHVLNVKINFKTSLLLGRAFLATVGAVCDLKFNKLCLTLIDPTTFYDPVQVIKLSAKETPNDVAACFCSHEYDSMDEYETNPIPSTDESNISSTDIQTITSTDVANTTSIDRQPFWRTNAEILASIDQLFKEAAIKFPDGDFEPTTSEPDDYIPLEEPHNEDYEEERAIECRFIREEEDGHTSHNFIFQASTDRPQSTSTDMPPRRSLKRPYQPSSDPIDFISFYTPSKDIRDGDYSIGSWASDHNESFAVEAIPLRYVIQPEEGPSTDTFQKQSIDNRPNTSPDAHGRPSPDTDSPPSEVHINNIDFGYLTPDEFGIFRDPDGNARAMDGRIIPITKEDIRDILQTANGSINLFKQPLHTPKEHISTTTLSNQDGAVTDHPITKESEQHISIDTHNRISFDMHREMGRRAFRDGIRRFLWEKKDEFGVFRDESGYARGVNGDIIHVSKEAIEELLHRASLFDRACFCLPTHSNHFNKAEKLYTEAEVKKKISQAISPYIWETSYFPYEIEKVRSGLQSTVDWITSAHAIQKLKKEALEEEVAALRLKLKSYEAPSTDAEQRTSNDRCLRNTYSEEELTNLISNIYHDIKQGEANTIKDLQDKYQRLSNNFASFEERTSTMADTMDHIINALHHTSETMKSFYNSKKRIIDEMIPPMETRLQEVEDTLRRFCKDYRRAASIDANTFPSPDMNPSEFCTKDELEKTAQDLFTMIQEVGDSSYQSFEDLWFPVQSDVQNMENTIENIQQEIKAISRQLANRPVPLVSTDISARESTDRPTSVSIDMDYPRSIDRLMARRRTFERLNDIQEELGDLSQHAYPTLRNHQFRIERNTDNLECLRNEVNELRERLTSRDTAPRMFFTTGTRGTHTDEACFSASIMNPPH